MMSLNMNIRLKEDKGVTLIELLIALVISGVLIAALYRTFIGQQKTYTVQEQVADMQQNVRVAISRMMREIRMAGFGTVKMVLPVQFIVSGNNRTFPNVINPDNPSVGSLTVVSAIGGPATITGIPSQKKITVSRLTDDQGDRLFDTGNRKYISIGGVESNTITDIQGNTITLNSNLVHNHPTGTPVFPIRAISYQVVIDDDGNPRLKRDENLGGGRQPFADNIESFQFRNPDGSVPLNPNSMSLQVSVTARTNMADPDYKGEDGFRRRTIFSHIQIRNMGISP
jgi:prepilin-type N-terminal cleavage/methylation domain-containing protein